MARWPSIPIEKKALMRSDDDRGLRAEACADPLDPLKDEVPEALLFAKRGATKPAAVNS